MNTMMAEFSSAGHIHVELAYMSNYGSLGAPKKSTRGLLCLFGHGNAIICH